MPKRKKISNPYYSNTDNSLISVSDSEWQKILPSDVFKVAREKATEFPFTGKYLQTASKGIYYCAICGKALFRSNSKIQTECGWPTFLAPLDSHSVILKPDYSYGMDRTEVLCGRCNSHLGHLFRDTINKINEYCINSIILDFHSEGIKM